MAVQSDFVVSIILAALKRKVSDSMIETAAEAIDLIVGDGSSGPHCPHLVAKTVLEAVFLGYQPNQKTHQATP